MTNEHSPAEKKRLPLQEGLTGVDENGNDRLLASRCPDCDLVFFPQRKYCGKCGSHDQPTFFLNGRGTVFGYSLIDRKSQFSIVEPPYVQAEVAMPEGVHVFTVLDQCDISDVKTGMEVEAYVSKVHTDKEGNDIVAYKFKPVAPLTGSSHSGKAE